MHIFFSGIGGSAANALALLAKEAGFSVSGSDAFDSSTINYLHQHGIADITIGQSQESIASVNKQNPIDQFVYTSALPANHPELEFCEKNGIPVLKHDEFLSEFINQHKQKVVAVAGTHGKSTTTAMVIWLLKELGIRHSYCIGAKFSFGEPGHFEADSEYFVLEADEYDRKFLSFYPEQSLISGLDYDHPDIYPTRTSYDDAFREFLSQSNHTYIWHDDADRLDLVADKSISVLDANEPRINSSKLLGEVNRHNAWLVASAIANITAKPADELFRMLDEFPGLSRRFEQLTDNIYSDYAHTPPKMRGALQLAHEIAGKDVVVVYEGLHNTRQHFIARELAHLFDGVKKLYIVPSYLAREDPNLEVLSPSKMLDLLSNSSRGHTEPAELNESLFKNINKHAADGDLVLCLSAGSAGSLDEWLRKNL